MDLIFGKDVKLREDRVLKRIEGVVGRDNLFTDPEHRVSYSYDALNQETLPAAVAFPRSAWRFRRSSRLPPRKASR